MKIQSFAQFRSLLADTLTKVDAFLEGHAGDKAVTSIRDQLAYAEQLTREGSPLTDEQVAKLSVGVLAARYVETSDLDLAQQIYDVEDFLETWRG